MDTIRFAQLVQNCRSLMARINRARAYPGVAALVQAGVIRFPRKPLRDGTMPPPIVLEPGQRFVTAAELAILRTKGNPAIRLNELFRIYPEELEWLTKNHPNLLPLCRQHRYADDEWWRDPRRIDDAKPKYLFEDWGQARSLSLAYGSIETPNTSDYEPDHEPEDPASDSDPSEDSALAPETSEEAGEGVVARNQSEREDLIAEIEAMRTVEGEDNWTETEYPVLEGQARFAVRGSNDDLNDWFGEEPKDPRTFIENHQRLQTWSANGMVGYMETAGSQAVVPNTALEEGCRGQTDPEIEEVDDRGKPRKRPAFFVTRQEFFAALDEQEHHREAVNALKKRKRTPGAEPFRSEHPLFTRTHPVHVNPPAPEKPRLRKGQKWVGITTLRDGSIKVHSPSLVGKI